MRGELKILGIVLLLACAGCGSGGHRGAENGSARSPKAAASPEREAHAAVNAKPNQEQRFPKIGDLFIRSREQLNAGWHYEGGGFFDARKDGCCVDRYYSDDGREAIIITAPVGHDAEGGILSGRVTNILVVEPSALDNDQCNIGGENALIAQADENWRNGQAYFTDGKAIYSKRWGAKAPAGCGPPEDPESRD